MISVIMVDELSSKYVSFYEVRWVMLILRQIEAKICMLSYKDWIEFIEVTKFNSFYNIYLQNGQYSLKNVVKYLQQQRYLQDMYHILNSSSTCAT